MGVKIIPIRMMVDNIYILKGNGTILVDGGDPGKMPRFLAALQKHSIKPEEIKLIVLTHGHWDHTGCASEIKDYTGAKILLHHKDLHLMEGTPPPEPTGFTPWGKTIIGALKAATRSVHVPHFEVDILADDGEISLEQFGIPGRVVHTPGHSPGSISVVLDSGEAFVGDLGVSMFPLRLTPGLIIFGDDMQVIKESWRKLRDLGVKTVYPAHGKPFPAEAVYRVL